MAISEFLLGILVCPENKAPVTLASREIIEKVNQRIASGALLNRGGSKITEPIAEGLIREDGAFLYPIRDDIPIMLIEEGIPLN